MPSDFHAINNPLGFTVKLLAITKAKACFKKTSGSDFQYNLTLGAKDLKTIPTA